MSMTTVLSYGLGVDSTAILLRWLHEPATRDFDLEDLVVVTAMTGDEWGHTQRDVEAHILPLLREHGIRYVQVARERRYVTTAGDGVAVLDDSREPARLFLEGAYRLSDEMLDAGTVPQSGGARLCSVHAKGDALDPVIARITDGRPFRHVVGFEANEPSRAAKDARLNTALRTAVYPLIEWGWNRQMCVEYIASLTGIEWQKSACVFCPFSLQNKASLARQLELYREHPEAGVAALFMEEVSLALNPAQSLIPRKPLGPILIEAGLHEVIRLTLDRLNDTEHAIYDVRRILRARKDDPTKFANAARSIRRVGTGPRAQMVRVLGAHPLAKYEDGFHRLHLRRRGDTFPTAERFLTVAPAVVRDKQEANFETWWREATGEEEAA